MNFPGTGAPPAPDLFPFISDGLVGNLFSEALGGLGAVGAGNFRPPANGELEEEEELGGGFFFWAQGRGEEPPLELLVWREKNKESELFPLFDYVYSSIS